MNLSRSALLPFSARQMYDVVADIQAYPEFLQWCSKTDVLHEDDGQVTAKVCISYNRFDTQFTTRNTNQAGESIQLKLVDGPFRHLTGLWRFDALADDACKVSLEMDFEFSSGIMSSLISPVFSKLIIAQFDAFQERAKQLYA